MKAFYCPGSHWDREWYEPFQTFRMWLVDLIDEAMDLLESNPEYRCFHLDGQAVVLEDYLEIRPERRDRLAKLLQEGRLLAGPWYDLPDEWLISSESYVRNLMMGMRVCRDMGFEPMRFAYTPDQFGHIAALPMIMAGFGLKAGICWRGTQDETHPAIFNWIGPDGSRMVTFRLKDSGGYAPFLFFLRNPLREGRDREETIEQVFRPYMEGEKERSPIPLTLMLDANDHERVDLAVPALLDALRERFPDVDITWGSLEELGEEMAAQADNLPEYRGELRAPCRNPDRRYQYLIVHTLSSRYPLKRRNGQCQALLERWAEPCALFDQLAEGKPILSYLNLAWKYLLRNHPHDSICGCSIDQVHRDMAYRFDQAELLGDNGVNRAFAHYGQASAETAHLGNVVVHNPLPYARKEIVDLRLVFPPDWPHRYADGLSTAEPVNRFHLAKKDGTAVPYQIRGIERGQESKRLDEHARGIIRGGEDIYGLAVELDLPPCGFTALRVEPTTEANRHTSSLLKAPLTADNGLIRLRLSQDGLGKLTHVDSGNVYEGLFLYEDGGDAGDGWTYGKPVSDLVFKTSGTQCTTAVEEEGPLRTTFRVERILELPPDINWSRFRRSGARSPLRIVDHISIEKGAPFLRVKTEVQNTCKDHRLRVLFPSGVESHQSFADSPFAVVERPINIPEEAAGWHERTNPEKPMSTFCGVQSGERGLALLAPFGPHEYAVLDDEPRTLALTLFRSTRKTVGTSGEPGGQLLEDMVFDYLVYPFAGKADPVKLSRYVAMAQAGVRMHVTRDLPDDHSFLRQVSGEAVVTAIKPSAEREGGIIRLWNPSDHEVRDGIHLNRPIDRVSRCNLNEENLETLTIEADGTIMITVPARGIATIHFTWE